MVSRRTQRTRYKDGGREAGVGGGEGQKRLGKTVMPLFQHVSVTRTFDG